MKHAFVLSSVPIEASIIIANRPLPSRIRRTALVLLLLAIVGLLAGCEWRLRQTSVAEMDAAEARWQAQPLLNYHMITEISRPGERRRYDITVVQGEVVSAVMELYDAGQKTWREPYVLSQSQAFPFTVPGMFETTRGALRSSGRARIRVEMGQDPAFPVRIELGPVWDRGQMVKGTESEIRVRLFEPLSAP